MQLVVADLRLWPRHKHHTKTFARLNASLRQLRQVLDLKAMNFVRQDLHLTPLACPSPAETAAARATLAAVSNTDHCLV